MTTDSLFHSLQQVLNYFKELHQLLQQDRTYFSEHNVAGIESSNVNKSNLLNQLNPLIQQIRTDENSTLLTSIKNSNRDATSKNKLQQLVEEIQKEVTDCYQFLAVNNNIVYTNLNQLSALWKKILSYEEEVKYVYDCKAKK